MDSLKKLKEDLASLPANEENVAKLAKEKAMIDGCISKLEEQILRLEEQSYELEKRHDDMVDELSPSAEEIQKELKQEYNFFAK